MLHTALVYETSMQEGSLRYSFTMGALPCVGGCAHGRECLLYVCKCILYDKWRKTIDLEENEKFCLPHIARRKLYCAGESLISPAELRGWWGIPSPAFPPSDEIKIAPFSRPHYHSWNDWQAHLWLKIHACFSCLLCEFGLSQLIENKRTDFYQNDRQTYLPCSCLTRPCLEWCSGRQPQCIILRISRPGTSVRTQFRVFLQALILPFGNVQLNGKSAIKGCENSFIHF